MAEKRVSVRLVAVGGRQVRAELEGIGDAGTRGFGRLSSEMELANTRLGSFARKAGIALVALTLAAAAAGVAMVRSGLETIGAQADMAASLKTTVESLQVLTWAGEFRTTDIVLIDFVGGIIDSATLRHARPGADHVDPALYATVESLLLKISKAKRRRIAGIGLALPEGFSDTEELKTFKDRAEANFALEVFVQNDVTAAANGESMFGIARTLDNYLLFYIGTMVHARLVLNHQIHRSGTNSAYDVGLLHFERALGSNDVSSEDLWRLSGGLPQYASAVESWKSDCVSLLASKVREARQFVDVGTVVLSSYAPRDLCQAICDELSNTEEGLTAVIGSIHHSPKAVGAASLPYASRFTTGG